LKIFFQFLIYLFKKKNSPKEKKIDCEKQQKIQF